MRRGREFYSDKYEKALDMHVKGMEIKQIAKELGISYSACYHWIKGLRQPEKGNVVDFIDYIKTNGPMPAIKIKEKFPKHNELFLIANQRSLDVRRHTMSRQFHEYRTWYYLPGQEQALQQRLDELFAAIKKVKSKFTI
jgi:hypothetical protein